VVGAEPAQLALALVDLAVEFVDQAKADLDRALPWFGKSEPSEQLATADAEEIRDRTGLPWVSSTDRETPANLRPVSRRGSKRSIPMAESPPLETTRAGHLQVLRRREQRDSNPRFPRSPVASTAMLDCEVFLRNR
jgi:hypothetical protein